MSIEKPDGYQDLDAYLNKLDAATWRAILHARVIGYDEYVIRYWRRMDRRAFAALDDYFLLGYLVARDLRTDFYTVKERLQREAEGDYDE